jgi:hypothetical protein
MSSTTLGPSPTVGDASTPTSSDAMPSCTTAVPDQYGYVPTDACNSYYNFYPNYAGNLAFAVLFGLTTLVHLVQAIVHKKVSRAHKIRVDRLRRF